MRIFLRKLTSLVPIALGLCLVSPVYASTQSAGIFQLVSGGDLEEGLSFTNTQEETFRLTTFSTTYADADWLGFNVTLNVSGSNVTVEFESVLSATLNTGSYVATYNLDLPPNYTFTGTTFTVTTPSSPANFSATTSSGATGNTINNVTSTLNVTSQNTFASGDGFTSNYQTVPWETDVLPLVVATALFTGAAWWKQKRGQKTVISDQLSGNSEES